jgi:hypothetical protein
MDPLVFSLANEISRGNALSARPDAPVIPERPPRRRRVPDSTRRAAAVALRRLADRLEPCPSAPSVPA